jgi:hypothetical protein
MNEEIVEQLEAMNDNLEIIAEKLVLLTTPEHLRDSQRKLFRTVRHRRMYRSELFDKQFEYKQNPTDELKENINNLEKIITGLDKEFYRYLEEGCEVL